MQKNKVFIKEFANGKAPASLSHSFIGAKPSKAQKRHATGIAVQRSRNPMPNQGQFVRRTAAVLMAFALIFGLLPAFVAAQDGSDKPRGVGDIYAPMVVGRPPSDAKMGLARLESGEIRHYNFGEQRDGKGPLYIASFDNGLTWTTRELDVDATDYWPPDSFPGADQRSPICGEYIPWILRARPPSLRRPFFCTRTVVR